MNITSDLRMPGVRTGYFPNRSSQRNLTPATYGERILWCCDVLINKLFRFCAFFIEAYKIDSFFVHSHLVDISDCSNI